MNLYIIGNGFDLDLGLQTSYNSFIQSEDFKKLLAKSSSNNLASHINNYFKRQKDQWCDLEITLGSYVNEFCNVHPDVLKSQFAELKSELKNYLKKRIFQKTSIFCLPSYYGEGIPKVLLEAAASGLPIITSDHPGCREAIIHGRSGFLVKTKNPNSIVTEIEKLISNKDLIRKFGKSSAKLAKEKFSLETVINKHLKIYNKLKYF